MSWWVLVLLWLLLLLVALALVALVGLRTFRRFRALLGELARATDQLTAAAEGRAAEPGTVAAPPSDALRSSTRRTP